MAFLFRPASVKPVPANAVRCRINKKQCVRWPKRGGGFIAARLLKSGKCKVVSPVWWVEYRDAAGARRRQAVSRDRKAAEHRMAEIVQDVERSKGGLRPKSDAPAVETLTALARRYEQHLLDLGRTEQHAGDTRRRVEVVLADCGWTRIGDVTADRWVRWAGAARRGTGGAGSGNGISAETINHYLRSLRSFFRWAFKADPLASVRLLNADADRRIRRRALAPEEFRRFIDSTRTSNVVRIHLDGPSRAALYLFAARTGLRAGVLAQLRPVDLRLDAPVPHVPVEAKRQKGRKSLHVPIPRSVVDELRPWVEARPADELLWPGPWRAHCHAAKMVRKDLRAAGIPTETPDGGYDFHALRKQCGTDLARAGVPLTTTQHYLGHSTPALTAKLYVHVGLADLGAAADRLGSELGSNSSEPDLIRCSRKGKPVGPKATKKPGPGRESKDSG